MRAVWTDVDPATGRYRVCPGEEPREWAEEEVYADPRFGSTALMVELEDGDAVATTTYYDAEMCVDARLRGLGGERAVSWRASVEALLAACAAQQELDEGVAAVRGQARVQARVAEAAGGALLHDAMALLRELRAAADVMGWRDLYARIDRLAARAAELDAD